VGMGNPESSVWDSVLTPRGPQEVKKEFSLDSFPHTVLEVPIRNDTEAETDSLYSEYLSLPQPRVLMLGLGEVAHLLTSQGEVLDQFPLDKFQGCWFHGQYSSLSCVTGILSRFLGTWAS
jgi:hypothetical protein